MRVLIPQQREAIRSVIVPFVRVFLCCCVHCAASWPKKTDCGGGDASRLKSLCTGVRSQHLHRRRNHQQNHSNKRSHKASLWRKTVHDIEQMYKMQLKIKCMYPSQGQVPLLGAWCVPWESMRALLLEHVLVVLLYALVKVLQHTRATVSNTNIRYKHTWVVQ